MRLDQAAIREALERLPDVVAQEDLRPPRRDTVYVPRLHGKALRPDVTVVIGMRGAGKSWWTAALADEQTRLLANSLGGIEHLQGVETRVGFGLDDSNRRFPSADAIRGLLASGSEPRDIWWAVVAHHAAEVAGIDPGWGGTDWPGRVAYAAADRPRGQALLTACDDALQGSGRTLMVLLDALDRLSTDWDALRGLTRAALEVALALRSSRSLRMKVFLRPDLDEDPRIWSFADSSKLRQGRVELEWQVADLYSMLWSRLANDDSVGVAVTGWLEALGGVTLREADGVRSVAPLVDGERVKQLTETIASPHMGTNKKRGLTHRWIPLHLADAASRISPRSWLIAFRAAAEETSRTRPLFDRALHYEGIQHGVARASQIRVGEIAEDHPWVESLLAAARDLQVPCRPEDLLARWTSATLPSGDGPKLPPRRFATDPVRQGQPAALIDDLVDLAVLYRAADKRLNIPDIFRVGFGIRRKGGVRPPR